MSSGGRQAAPSEGDGQCSWLTYKCMPRRAASVGGSRWSSSATPTSTVMPAPTQLGALPRGLGGLRPPERNGMRNRGHDPNAPPVPAQGGHLPGQRAPPAMIPAGERLRPQHGTPPGAQVGPPPGPPGSAGPPRHCKARGGGQPLQPHRGPPPPVRCRGRARPVLPVGGGHLRARQALPGALAGPGQEIGLQVHARSGRRQGVRTPPSSA